MKQTAFTISSALLTRVRLPAWPAFVLFVVFSRIKYELAIHFIFHTLSTVVLFYCLRF